LLKEQYTDYTIIGSHTWRIPIAHGIYLYIVDILYLLNDVLYVVFKLTQIRKNNAWQLTTNYENDFLTLPVIC
jgi:hypothetical protein